MPAIYLINGKGGADYLVGGESRDYFKISDVLSGLNAITGGTVVYGQAGDDVFRYHARHADGSGYVYSPWVAPEGKLYGGTGTDVIAINGEWGPGGHPDWDIRSITLDSIEQVYLAWWPHGSTLTLRLTTEQWLGFEKIRVDSANSYLNLRLIVDDTQLTAETIAPKVIVEPNWQQWDPPADAVQILGSTAGGERLAVPTEPNDLPTGSVTISGTVTQGETLTASNTLADADGLGEITYIWKANGATIGTGSTYALTQAEVDKTITVTASYTDDQGTTESVGSEANGLLLEKLTPTGAQGAGETATTVTVSGLSGNPVISSEKFTFDGEYALYFNGTSQLNSPP